MQDTLLQISHARTAETVSNFEAFGIESAWRTHLRRDFRADGDQYGRDSFHFDFTLDRDDRAVTDIGSTTREHDRIRA